MRRGFVRRDTSGTVCEGERRVVLSVLFQCNVSLFIGWTESLSGRSFRLVHA